MDRKYQMSKFCELRFEYYSAGRTLWFTDNMETAAILLGYAVELSLKQILVATGNDKYQMNSHNVISLYARANDLALKGAVPVTEDLLHFVTDRLHHRYPRQVEETVADAQKRGQAVCLSLDVIAAYDDLTLELDEWLRKSFPEEGASLGMLAAHFVNRTAGRSVFHANSAALAHSELYKALLLREYEDAEVGMAKQGLTPETIQYNLTMHKARLAAWAGAPNGLWVANHLTTRIGAVFHETPRALRASSFVYPGHYVVGPGSS
jgi:hypothetical protein